MVVFDKEAYRNFVESYKGKKDEQGILMTSQVLVCEYLSRTTKIAGPDAFLSWMKPKSAGPRKANLIALEDFFGKSFSKKIIERESISELIIILFSFLIFLLCEFTHKSELLGAAFFLIVTGLQVITDEYGNDKVNKIMGSGAMATAVLCTLVYFL